MTKKYSGESLKDILRTYCLDNGFTVPQEKKENVDTSSIQRTEDSDL